MNRLFFLSLLSASSCATALDFNRDVRPVLAQQCFSCHGMDDHGRRGKLRLDLPNAAYGSGKSGEVAIKPYQPDSSEVVKRIFHLMKMNSCHPRMRRRSCQSRKRP